MPGIYILFFKSQGKTEGLMNTRNHFRTRIILGASLLAFSQVAWSLGLGEAKVESFLGQPLEVKIELITGASDDLASVSARLASAADYELIGASRDDVSVPLQFSIENPDGNAYIAVHSKLDINNPVLRLILEVNWPNGRMLREYTLFLDPATFSQPAPAPRIETEKTIEPATEAQPVPAPRVEPASTAGRATEAQPPQPAPAPAGDAVISGAEEYGPVKSGDTLWRIAKDWSAGSGLNLNKVMLAIQRENPRAFSKNNINLLHRGAILRMPQRDDIDSMSSAVASSEVQKQSDAFQSRQSVSMASSDVPLIAEESVVAEPVLDEQTVQQVEEQVEEQLAQNEESLSEPVPEEEPIPEDLRTELAPSQLELLPPSEDNSLDSTYGFEESEAAADDAVSARALREELSRKEEELINQQQQNEYLEQRLAELEEQLEESRAGSVEDKNLASMEERLREERLRDAQSDAPKVVSSPTPDEPWYSRFSLWLLGLLVLVVVIVAWLMSRRGSSDTVVSDLGGATDPLREIKGEAEDVLRVLDSTPEEKAAEEETAEEKTDQEEATEDVTAEEAAETAATGESEDTQAMPARKNLADADVEAHILDEESADPEIQLDLARAYISMGDREAARVILEEVIANGSEEQQAEANKMKDML
jgi:pilus assembly protein FimV